MTYLLNFVFTSALVFLLIIHCSSVPPPPPTHTHTCTHTLIKFCYEMFYLVRLGSLNHHIPFLSADGGRWSNAVFLLDVCVEAWHIKTKPCISGFFCVKVNDDMRRRLLQHNVIISLPAKHKVI